jgi:Cotton fibre expressed protein
VYLDELYAQPNPVQLAVVHKHTEMPKEVIREPEDAGVMGKKERSDNSVLAGMNSESNTDIREADDVDLRAEIFIRKFKEEMRMQGKRL